MGNLQQGLREDSPPLGCFRISKMKIYLLISLFICYQMKQIAAGPRHTITVRTSDGNGENGGSALIQNGFGKVLTALKSFDKKLNNLVYLPSICTYVCRALYGAEGCNGECDCKYQIM